MPAEQYWGSPAELLIRATLEATAYQVANLFAAMEADVGRKINVMCYDGGATKNVFLMQFKADILGVPLNVPDSREKS